MTATATGATMTALHTVTRTATSDLVINDIIDCRGDRRQVVELADNGKPALFGTGNEWTITLQDEAGRLRPMVAATSDLWNRIGG